MVHGRFLIAALFQASAGVSSLVAQSPPQAGSVTLAEAIRLSERVQPDVIRAIAGVQTAGASRRSAWGAFLPTLSASSSASDFFSEGTGRIDPITGQLTGGNTSNRFL